MGRGGGGGKYERLLAELFILNVHKTRVMIFSEFDTIVQDLFWLKLQFSFVCLVFCGKMKFGTNEKNLA